MSLLKKVDPKLLAGARHIVETLRSHGHKVLYTGGLVRDLLLDRPISDVDIATSARPEQIELWFDQTVAVGKQFGVIMVVKEGTSYEVATFRTDEGYQDGRHPVGVKFTNSAEDALRRDFTVNAMYLDPWTEEILDEVGGRQDLQRRMLRTVGDPARRFGEDRLRMLRAIRFACDLDFELEMSSYQEIARQAVTICQVSRERIRDELLRILTGPDPERGLQLLADTGLLAEILPEVSAMQGVLQPRRFHPEGDVFTHTRLLYAHAGKLSEVLALAILLHDAGKPPTFQVRERIRFDGHADLGAEMASEICQRLRLSRSQTSAVVELVRGHLRFMNVRQMRESKLKRFLRQEHFTEHLELHRLDCLASHGDLSNYHFCLQKLEEFGQEEVSPPRLITGHDLIGLGLEPGPLFSKILTEVEDQQLEGEFSDRQQALDWIKAHYGPAT